MPARRVRALQFRRSLPSLVLLLTLTAGCVNLDQPRAWACGDAGGCDVGWFCATDGYCHDQSKGEPLACVTSADCGGQFHCGAEHRCYDRTDAGPIECRRDEATAPLFSADDCADEWRCGVDNRCFPSLDAGAIACRYGIDSDCTDDWRCGFAGRCVDPSSEQQRFADAGLTVAALIRRDIPTGDLLALSPFETDSVQQNSASKTVQSMLITTDGGELLMVQRIVVSTPSGQTIDFPFVAFGSSGGITQSTADVFGGYVMRDGLLRRLSPDGGDVPVLDPANQPIGPARGSFGALTELRTLPQQPGAVVSAAFVPASASPPQLLLVRPDQPTIDPGFPISGLVDALGFPAPEQRLSEVLDGGVCWLRMSKAFQASDDTSVAVMRGGLDQMQNGCGFSINRYQPGDLRVGSGGIVAYIDRLSVHSTGTVQRAPRLRGVDLSAFLSCQASAAPTCPKFQCERACTVADEELVDFVPWRDGTSLGFDVACRTGQGIRWSRLTATDTDCERRQLTVDRELFANLLPQPAMRATLDGGEPRAPQDFAAPPQVTPGGFLRAVRRGAQMNLSTGASALTALPWFNDRVPRLAVDLTGVADGTLTLVSPELMVNRSSHRLVANDHANDGTFSVVTRVEGNELMAITNGGGVIRVAVTTAGAQIEEFGALDIAPEKFVEPVRGVLSTGIGRRFLAVSVGDTLYTDLYPTDGGVPRPQPVVAPDPGQPIIGLADGEPAPDAGITNSVWVATRFSVQLTLRSQQVGWRAVPSGLTFPAPVVTVWNGEAHNAGHTARVGLTTGEVRSLPSGLRLADALESTYGDAQDYREICGQLFVATVHGVLRLGEAQQWVGVFSADDLTGAKVFDTTPVASSQSSQSSCNVTVVNRLGDGFEFTVHR